MQRTSQKKRYSYRNLAYEIYGLFGAEVQRLVCPFGGGRDVRNEYRIAALIELCAMASDITDEDLRRKRLQGLIRKIQGAYHDVFQREDYEHRAAPETQYEVFACLLEANGTRRSVLKLLQQIFYDFLNEPEEKA